MTAGRRARLGESLDDGTVQWLGSYFNAAMNTVEDFVLVQATSLDRDPAGNEEVRRVLAVRFVLHWPKPETLQEAVNGSFGVVHDFLSA